MIFQPNEHFLLSSFLPCVEPKMEGAVITSEPGEKLCKNGRRIPFMLGANTLEGLIFKRESKFIILF